MICQKQNDMNLILVQTSECNSCIEESKQAELSWVSQKVSEWVSEWVSDWVSEGVKCISEIQQYA